MATRDDIEAFLRAASDAWIETREDDEELTLYADAMSVQLTATNKRASYSEYIEDMSALIPEALAKQTVKKIFGSIRAKDAAT